MMPDTPRRPGVGGAPMPGAIEPVDPGQAPASPDAAQAVFGDRLPLAERYAHLLATTGVTHGLIGPREIPRLWERHILNCAVIEGAFPEAAEIIDVGSGAGLPGLVLASARPDLTLHLVEPMQRRTDWLEGAVAELGLRNVTVHRGRANDVAGQLSTPWVTARAVAKLDKLAGWCFPLLEPHGTLVAMKGSAAQVELDEALPALRRLGAVQAEVSRWGEEHGIEPTATVSVQLGARVTRRPSPTEDAVPRDRRPGRRPRSAARTSRRPRTS